MYWEDLPRSQPGPAEWPAEREASFLHGFSLRSFRTGELGSWGTYKVDLYIYIHTHTYHGSKKAAATLMPAATATTYVTIRLLSMRATKMRNGTAD